MSEPELKYSDIFDKVFIVIGDDKHDVTKEFDVIVSMRAVCKVIHVTKKHFNRNGDGTIKADVCDEELLRVLYESHHASIVEVAEKVGYHPHTMRNRLNMLVIQGDAQRSRSGREWAYSMIE